MRATVHSHLRGDNGCLGLYYGLEPLLADFPEGGLPGEFFINGKSQSIRIWDSMKQTWCDSNHAVPAPVIGVITDPKNFSPTVEPGEPACYVYIAREKGTYVFPSLQEGATLTIETDMASAISLVWDGTVWRNYVTPLQFDGIGAPHFLYRGLWSAQYTYSSTGGIVDVVRLQDKYYRVKSSVESTSGKPSDSDDWEEAPRFCAIADQLDLRPNELIILDERQCIRTTNLLSSWDMCDGEIRHLETGTFLSQAGELRVPIGSAELVISPISKGFVIYGNNKKVMQIDFDTDKIVTLTMGDPHLEGSYRLSVSPRQIEHSYFDGNGTRVRYFSISANGMNGILKKWTDTLSEGDIYVDENNFLKQKQSE